MAVLFGMYWMFLRKETYFQFNRIYLLGTVLFACMIPFGNFSFFESSYESSALIVISSVGEAVRIPEMTLADRSTIGFSLSNNWQDLVIVIYLLGTSILLARIILGIIRINELKKTGRRIDHDGYSVVYIKQQFAPFSFFRTIFINESQNNSSETSKIIDHEVIHITQLHTYDNLIVEICLAVLWFNPFMWFIKRALRNTHEYLADNSIIKTNTSLVKYQSLLLKQIHGLSSLVVTNNFNSMIKNRIKMMCKSKSTVLAKAKLLLLIPVIMCLALIFACSGNEQLKENFTVEQAEKLKSEKDNLSTEQTDTLKSDNEYDIQDDEIFIIVEEMPHYPGGEEALYEYIYNNIEYPAGALDKGISGMVIVRFCVTRQGDVTQAVVLRGVDPPSLDKEAIRLVESLPEKWIPGKQAGKPVNVYFVVRIQFQLPD